MPSIKVINVDKRKYNNSLALQNFARLQRECSLKWANGRDVSANRSER